MPDIDYAKYPSTYRMEAIQTGDKEKLAAWRKLETGINRLAQGIFRQAYVREHSLEAAILAVYMTGLYHGSTIESNRNESGTDHS